MIARCIIYTCEKNIISLFIERRACIEFELRGARVWGRGWRRWNINRWCFNRGTLYCWKSGLKGSERQGEREIFGGISERRHPPSGRRTKRSSAGQRRRWIVNDCRLKYPLRSGPRQVQRLDWQMAREICICCEVLPILLKNRTRPLFVRCSFNRKFHGRNLKKKVKWEINRCARCCPVCLYINVIFFRVRTRGIHR